MSVTYKQWQLLDESLGFPLGVKTTASIGLTGDIARIIDEAKKKTKKKMDLGIGDDDDSEISLGSNDEGGDDIGDDDGDDDGGGGCKCDKPDIDLGGGPDDGGKGLPMKKPGLMMCKKCKKMKKMKKKMKAESAEITHSNEVDIFSVYNDTTFKSMPELGSEEYERQWEKSVATHFADPNKKFSSGVDLEEEVLFEPQDDNAVLAAEPSPGEPGFAPMSRVGGSFGETAPEPASWEKNWERIPSADEAAEFLRQAGLTESFEAWQKKKSK